MMRYINRFLIVCFLLCNFLLAGCDTLDALMVQADTPARTQPAPPDAELIAQGRAVYLEQYCGVCHQLTSANTRGDFGPPHDNMGQLAQLRLTNPNYAGNATTATEYIMESLLEPQIYFTEGYAASSHAMPTYAHLSDDKLNALVYMLMNE